MSVILSPTPGDLAAPPHPRGADAEVPQLLDSQRIHQLRREFEDEYGPQGPTERYLVRCLAQQAAALDRFTLGTAAVEREAARAIPQFAAGGSEDDDARYADVLLAAALQSEGAERCERHCLALVRGFQRTQRRLEELQAQRRRREAADHDAPPTPIVDEAACIAHLERRLRRDRPCDRCHASHGSYLPSRRLRECAGCGKQIGLRYGTVMAGSPLPLRTWFTAVRLILWRPMIGVAELAEHLGVRRLPTVRTIAQRIRDALRSEQASELLAGLDAAQGDLDFPP